MDKKVADNLGYYDWNSNLPLSFSADIYVSHSNNKDLSVFNGEEALIHYEAFGMLEGRTCSTVKNRNDFVNLIPSELTILEIGPFFSPAFKKSETNVFYLDCLSTEALKERADVVPDASIQSVPEIDYVWLGQSYSDIVDRKFSVIFSSHNIEHQPCLVTHLNDIESVLEHNGAVFLVVPDKRYCFDHFFAETFITDVIDAWQQKRNRHRLKDILEHYFFTAHNEAQRHWKGDHGVDLALRSLEEGGRDVALLNELNKAISSDEYSDVHAWKFTPQSFSILFQNLFLLNLTKFRIARLYPTLKNSNEFYAVLVLD